MDIELPYRTEYAKSGRSSCKMCKCSISQGSLRLAAIVQSAFHDGKQPMWYHEDCFFKKQRPKSVGDIENFENIRFDDQQRITLKVEKGFTESAGTSTKKGKKRNAKENIATKDFGIEYAKSGRAVCRGCDQKILKDQVRVRKTVYDTEVGMKYGGQALWHHAECFAQLRSDLGWFDKADCLPGFESIKKEDQLDVLKLLPAIKLETGCVSKKPKIEDGSKEEEELYKLIEKQSKLLFKLRDLVTDEMQKKDIIYLLEYNNQDPVTGDSEKLLNQLSDMLAFGALLPCSQCNGRQILFSKSGYLCNGQLTEWTKCSNLIKDPERKPCNIPNNLKEKYSFLLNIKNKTEHRIVKYNPPSVEVIAKSVHTKVQSESTEPKVKRQRPPLYNFKFAYIGQKNCEKDLKMRVNKLGGDITSNITEHTAAVFSTIAEVKRMGSRMKRAKELGIHVIPIDYLDLVGGSSANVINYISSTTLCDWGTDPNSRISQGDDNPKKSKSIYTKSVAKSMTLKIKDGLAVDPESGLQDIAHVYLDNKDKYNIVLGLTDIQRNKNSYYKLQLLESDTRNKFEGRQMD
ncbi:poly [ADP-ribose] polymerase-like, partial [Rhagoletis pomonella]|uniref:poly [ADP-ribose] polymerase-like n=1 Tax=Rhagoletis pomonella TaxID=28610 RepID=UPI00177D28A7